jgi:hypothetical protein
MMQGLSNEKISKLTGLSVESIRMRFSRLRRRYAENRERDVAEAKHKRAAAEAERREGFDEGLRRVRASKALDS